MKSSLTPQGIETVKMQERGIIIPVLLQVQLSYSASDEWLLLTECSDQAREDLFLPHFPSSTLLAHIIHFFTKYTANNKYKIEMGQEEKIK